METNYLPREEIAMNLRIRDFALEICIGVLGTVGLTAYFLSPWVALAVS